MNPRLYTLIEKHQRIDERLRLAERRHAADPLEVEWLRAAKDMTKRAISRFMLRTAQV
ncbi:DUF465 domain-containing protein [Altererythrobacter sp. SALINAS58]|uniref:DUF465 domain-containing protein n=1 Tax=Alteripontixanthobacter muriae TaxID=2705546 RepID=UPI0015751576|nr:DUF465 domain-containing protein [Alteripontixanthobacter muriae]NTZ42668.1 DUF465 domain-containing protein [Alteripontixanthobacter muriae]